MNEEEKKAIEIVKNEILENCVFDEYCHRCGRDCTNECVEEGCLYLRAIETVLNLIQKQQHIIEGKEALIDTQSHNEEVYMKALEKQEKKNKRFRS